MKKFLNIALISLIFIGSANIGTAQTISADKFKSIVATQAKKDLQKYNVDDSEVIVGNIPVQSIDLPDGKITVDIVSNSTGIIAKEFKKININVGGKYVRSYYAPIETKAYKYVAVAKQLIQRDKVIPLQAVEFKRMNVVGNLDNTLDQSDIAREIVATRVFYPGDMLTKRYTMAKPDVVKNATVVVNFRTGSSINIAIDGMALMQGNIGDMIQVKNKKYNKIYTGEVIGVNQVLVQI